MLADLVAVVAATWGSYDEGWERHVDILYYSNALTDKRRW